MSFVVIGVVLSTPLLTRRRPDATWLAFAGGGLIADIVLKALLAPAWQRLLLSML